MYCSWQRYHAHKLMNLQEQIGTLIPHLGVFYYTQARYKKGLSRERLCTGLTALVVWL